MTTIGQVRIPEPYCREGDLVRFTGVDLVGMDLPGLERERARLQVAYGLASDVQLSERIVGPIGGAAITVEGWLLARLEVIDHILRERRAS